MISIVAGTVLLCWFINTTLLESYYVEHKQKTLLDTFDMVYRESENGRTDEDEFVISLDTKCSNSDISYMIISSDRTIIQDEGQQTKNRLSGVVGHLAEWKYDIDADSG